MFDTIQTLVQDLQRNTKPQLQTKENKMATKKVLDQLLTTNEVSQRFGIGYQAIMKSIKSGKLATIQPGGITGKHFIFLPEAERWSKTITRRTVTKPSTQLFLVEPPKEATEVELAIEKLETARKELDSAIAELKKCL